jgi:hypothetical protein
VAKEGDANRSREQRRRRCKKRGKACVERHRGERDEREGNRREEGTEDHEARDAAAHRGECPRSRDREEHRGADREADLGGPHRADLRRGDPEEQEGRTPHRPEVQERAEIDE